MKRYILMYDGSEPSYHAVAIDGSEDQVKEAARLYSEIYEVPVYVYETHRYDVVKA